MAIAVMFCIVSLFSIVRTVSFAVFTARDKNFAGASMLCILAFLVLACACFVIYRL